VHIGNLDRATVVAGSMVWIPKCRHGFALKEGKEEEEDATGAKYTEDSVYNADIDPFDGEAEEKQPDRYLDDACCHHVDQLVYVDI
jgi:hypothetical protein